MLSEAGANWVRAPRPVCCVGVTCLRFDGWSSVKDTRQPKPPQWVETSQGATCGTSGAIQLPTSRTTALSEDVGGMRIYVVTI
jgi:hypothetical protein